MSLLDFPYFAKISCFFSACKYSAICKKIKKLIKNRPKSPPGNFAAANLIIKSDKTIFQWKKLIITAMMPVYGKGKMLYLHSPLYEMPDSAMVLVEKKEPRLAGIRSPVPQS